MNLKKDLLVILSEDHLIFWKDFIEELNNVFYVKKDSWNHKNIYSFACTETLMNESYALILDPSIDLVYKSLNMCRLGMLKAFFGFSSAYWLDWKTSRLDLVRDLTAFSCGIITRCPLYFSIKKNIRYKPFPILYEAQQKEIQTKNWRKWLHLEENTFLILIDLRSITKEEISIDYSYLKKILIQENKNKQARAIILVQEISSDFIKNQLLYYHFGNLVYLMSKDVMLVEKDLYAACDALWLDHDLISSDALQKGRYWGLNFISKEAVFLEDQSVLLMDELSALVQHNKDFEKLSDQEKANFLCNKAESSINQSLFEDSLAYLEWSLRFDGESSRALYNLGKIAFLTESFEEAKAFFEKAYTIDSTNGTIKNWYTRTLEKL